MTDTRRQRPPVPSSSFAPDQGGGSSKQGEERLVELEEELEGVKWDIIGLGEVRRRGEDFTELKSGHHFYHIGTKDKSEAGVGFLIHKSIAGNITEVKGINERLAQLTVKINKRYKIKVIQVYAPTSTHNDEEVDKLYEEITELLKNSKAQFTIVMGDFNAKVGKREDGEECTIGKFGSGERNDRGDRLIEFSISNKLKIMNTFFKKPASRKWTWRSPDGSTKNEIDFILTDSPHIIQDVKTVNKVNSSINLEKLQEKRIEFQLQLQNQFQLLADECPEERTLELWNDQIVETTQKLAMDIAGKKPKTRATKISDSTRTLMEKRRSMKAEEQTYSGLNIQKPARQSEKSYGKIYGATTPR
ncbi:craniofacial development protein 2-like [Amphiura filiformis]|uniref:craniofacial development protein 2-like n=1 Tax=Amphiura filiformis TaxID=82378 RepID=UPI003B225150